jgi:CheY-like chemotaxis protein
MGVLDRLSSNVFSCSTLAQAEELIFRQTIHLVFCDEHLPDGTYRDLLRLIRSRQRTIPVVVISRVGEWKEYLEATQLGAFDVIPFPLRPTDVEFTVIRAMHGEQQNAAAMTAWRPVRIPESGARYFDDYIYHGIEHTKETITDFSYRSLTQPVASARPIQKNQAHYFDIARLDFTKPTPVALSLASVRSRVTFPYPRSCPASSHNAVMTTLLRALDDAARRYKDSNQKVQQAFFHGLLTGYAVALKLR